MRRAGRKRKSRLEKVIFSTRFIVIVLITIALSLGFVRIRFEEIVIGYKISVNKKIEEEILDEKSFLEAEYKKLRSPQRIEDLARNLGFKFPTQEDVIHIEKPTVIGEKR
jgi:cell division protein FtsL